MQPRKLIFGMQPYFYPTRKPTKKKWKTTSKKMKLKTPFKKNENGRQPHFFVEKLDDDLKTNGRRPKKEKWKTTSKKNGRRPNKIKWKTIQLTKINLIGCDTIVNSPS
jgi:hypothetical protein